MVAEITQAGGNALAVAADISGEDEVVLLFDTVIKQYGRLDALVNNAGVIDRQSKLVDMKAFR